MDEFCTFLSEYANSKGIKQTYISQKTGISIYAISRIFNGKRRILAKEFIQICSALEIPREELDAFISRKLEKNNRPGGENAENR